MNYAPSCRNFPGGYGYLESAVSDAQGEQLSPLVTVTVWDGVEVGVEDSIIHPERMDDMLAVVVLAAASVCILKHAYAQERNVNEQKESDDPMNLNQKEMNHASELSWPFGII